MQWLLLLLIALAVPAIVHAAVPNCPCILHSGVHRCRKQVSKWIKIIKISDFPPCDASSPAIITHHVCCIAFHAAHGCHGTANFFVDAPDARRLCNCCHHWKQPDKLGKGLKKSRHKFVLSTVGFTVLLRLSCNLTTPGVRINGSTGITETDPLQ